MIIFGMIRKLKGFFAKNTGKDLSDCFAPMTVVYHCGEEAYRKEWGNINIR